MKRSAPFALALLIFVFDQGTKLWIRNHLPLSYAEPKIEGFFNLVHAENPGAAFSMLATAPAWLRQGLLITMAAAIIVGILLALLGRIQIVETQQSRLALGLVLGGASGNLFDRLTAGTVTDFLEFYWRNYYFPAFNVADSAIFCGACLMILDFWLAGKTPDPAVKGTS